MFGLSALFPAFGCCCNEGDFGAKFCAVYRKYDSAALHLQKYLETQEDGLPHHWMFLGVSEMYRGRIPEMYAAWEKAEQRKLYPEQLLIRGNWHIESGDAEKADSDCRKLKKLLAENDFSADYNYYRYLLIVNILDAEHDSEWRKIQDRGYPQFLRFAADRLEEKLALLKRTPGKGPLVLRGISDPAWREIAFGMTKSELCDRLGMPQKRVDLSQYGREILVYFQDGCIAGFFFTRESQKLGEIRVFPICGHHGAESMRLLTTGKAPNFWKEKFRAGDLGEICYDDIFCRTGEYHDPDRFKWLCLACLRGKIGE